VNEVPRAKPGFICPLHRKDMAKVCHSCPLWIQVRGKNPNTGAEVDNWNCSLALLPMLMIENAQQARQAGAAIESFRNEFSGAGHALMAAIGRKLVLAQAGND
jgi:hypothetical protein